MLCYVPCQWQWQDWDNLVMWRVGVIVQILSQYGGGSQPAAGTRERPTLHPRSHSAHFGGLRNCSLPPAASLMPPPSTRPNISIVPALCAGYGSNHQPVSGFCNCVLLNWTGRCRLLTVTNYILTSPALPATARHNIKHFRWSIT